MAGPTTAGARGDAGASFATIGVVGAGTMGAGIAQLALEHGHDVLLHDVDAAAVARGRERIADGLARRVAKRGLDDEAAAEATSQAMARLRDAASLEDVAAEADLVVEAALEQLDLKRTIFAALDAGGPPTTLLATNTSALSVSALAAATTRPERVLGLHFFNPAPLLPLVEVVAGEASDGACLDAAARLVASWGKTPVRVRDVPGFIVNRVNRPFTLEPLRLLTAGEAGVARIDAALEAAGYPMGPFALMDLVGIDVNLAVAVTLWEGFFGEPRFRPSPVQRRLVDGGHLGRKTRRGFYRYDEAGTRLGTAPEFEAAPDGGLPDEAIVERVVLAIVNEAFHALGEGVATPDDIDLALELGARHPRGPFAGAERLGLGHVVRRLDELTALEGERFRPAPALRRALAGG
ncbi:MAG TPA: 3-hydroxyacyl-CoA dehydrogenase NAD-binding domain-containing protein [Candidatus Limnocylindrales bacterium]